MHRLPVESSDIVSVGYDSTKQILEVEFNQGRIYQYRDVEPTIHAQFMRAQSYGQYFFAHINGRYRYDKVTDDRSEPTKALAFVTGNARKAQYLRTACKPFGIEVEQLVLPVDEIQSTDPGDIATKKAKQAYKLAGRPVVISDYYWNIFALRGFPGAYMSDVAKWLRAEDLVALLADKTDRTVCRTETVVYYDGTRTKVFTKDFMGTMADQPRGAGQPHEQLVVFAGQTKTMAELHEQERYSGIDPKDSLWHEFAKWFNVQRRLGRA